MQRGQNQVPGFCGGQGGFARFTIANFSNQNHIRVFTQSGFEAVRKGRYVFSDFALRYGRFFIALDVFNGVFQCNDMSWTRCVDVINHGRQGRGFARTCSAGA